MRSWLTWEMRSLMNYLCHLTAFLWRWFIAVYTIERVAYDKGRADDPVKYFVAKENQDLGVVKSLRKPVSKLDLSPWTAPS